MRALFEMVGMIFTFLGALVIVLLILASVVLLGLVVARKPVETVCMLLIGALVVGDTVMFTLMRGF
jgi:hypothetical protein